MKKAILCAVLLAPVIPAFAQNGWSKAGAALGNLQQSKQAAYNQGVLQGEQQRAMLEAARAARLDSEQLEEQAQLRSVLAKTWKSAGLSAAEATAVANVYQIRNEQDAIIIRARNEGVKATYQHAMEAYKVFNYQLADELLMAGNVVFIEQSTAAATQSPSH